MKIVIGEHYEFDNQTDIIGRGGMGTVYRGKEVATGKLVAIKQLKPSLLGEDQALIARFIREAEVLRQLNHPHIISVYDMIHDVELGYYLVMEYISHGTLWDELQAYPHLSIPRALTITQQLTSAMILVHENNIIHRDIKPSNVLIADDKTPRLSDFGVIYLDEKTRITQTESIIGTLDYLAPEMLNGDTITPQTDIWALGVMLFEMLAGARPFPSDNPTLLLTAILTKPPIPLQKLRPDVPENVIRLVEWMLVKDPHHRADSMKTVYDTLQDIIAGTNIISIPITSTKIEKAYKQIGALPKLFTEDTFYDRTYQQATVTNAITEGKTFISIYGRGGIGKTALTSKVLADFEKGGNINGVAYLRANSTPILNITSLFDTLREFLPNDHPFHDTYKDASVSIADKTRSLINGLAGGRYLVYIDNIETLQHPTNYTLIDDGIRQFFETLLETKGGETLTILITSRYPLPFPNHLKPYETVVRLDEGLPPNDAIEFLRHMDKQNLLPETDTQLHLWIEKVGGYPRGLEALVGYLQGGDTRHIDDLLDDPALFEGEVLGNIVHHIHNALPDDFRQVMAGVAIIGQSTLRAELEYLLSPFIDSTRLRLILEKLVDGRFLIYNRQTRAYSLHPIDQAYALASTPEGSPDDDDKAFTQYVLNKRMADYFLNKRTAPDTWKTLDDLEPLLREMVHRYAIYDYDTSAQIMATIDFSHLLRWGHNDLVISWHTRLAGKIKNPTLAQNNIGTLGSAYYYMGNIQKASEYFRQALQLAQAQDDKQGAIRWLGNLGAAHNSLGELSVAVTYYQQGLDIAREMGNKQREGVLLGNLGIAYNDLGQSEDAIDYMQKALSIARELNDKVGIGVRLSNLGSVLTKIGRYSEAIEYLNQAIQSIAEIKALLLSQHIYINLTRAYWFSDNLDTAFTAITKAREYDASNANAVSATVYGCIAYCLGKKDEAKNAFDDGLATVEALLSKTANQYEPMYSRALAYTGLWLLTGDSEAYSRAFSAYTEAKKVNSVQGILMDNRQHLEALLRCSDKDGSALLAILQ
ncbi:MAG: serine/threonine-protein kinase [Anaerolineae bacterium]|nr:serine/threonine-protein kinase [Anaerolineae bacterium]